MKMHEARLYEPLDGGKIRCRLCAHTCVIAPGKRGICGVRENHEGRLYTLVYGKLVAANADPIEKKPLFHFQPGSRSFSIATAGCNFRCRFCQNWEISQLPRHDPGALATSGPETTPAQVVEAAAASGCRSISYTYTEPTVFFEFAADTMSLAHSRGLKNVFVTNGYQSPECLEALEGLLDGANVDLKAMSDEFYRHECGAKLAPVLSTLKAMKAMGLWVEVTTLLIPGRNDDPAQLSELAGFIATELGRDVPWHVSAYTPRYEYSRTGPPPTSVETLEQAAEIGRAQGLEFVYLGNVPGHGWENTYCPGCGRLLIERRGFYIISNDLEAGRCPGCHRAIAGVWE